MPSVSVLAEPLFWAAALPWLVAFKLGEAVSRRIPRFGPIPVQMLLVGLTTLAVVLATFWAPLALTGNMPLPCCEPLLAYQAGSVIGIAGAVVVRVIGSLGAWKRSRSDF